MSNPINDEMDLPICPNPIFTGTYIPDPLSATIYVITSPRFPLSSKISTSGRQTNKHGGRTRPSDGVEEELEEGEIIDGDDDETSSSAQPAKAVSHPLEYSWTFWFDSQAAAKSRQIPWGSLLRPIYTFSTVEEFWGYRYRSLLFVYNNIHHPSKLTHGIDFYCFKHKIEPKWEDPVCANGGNWTMTFSRGKSDNCWLYTLLAMIGEQFDHGDEICGAVVNVRNRQEKIALWTKNATNEGAQVVSGICMSASGDSGRGFLIAMRPLGSYFM
ncbi:hypothetical protein RJ639_011470 [Escallonia herrerae]|uniref:eIF-4F 25 kDa subunit n=1 Tax=Escallonia herrerae TaxID=1293975 RepID=A0AA89AQH5_9ASTE|nr:hypothetical protein RJ639_011470 [Escallonia herrerae]